MGGIENANRRGRFRMRAFCCAVLVALTAVSLTGSASSEAGRAQTRQAVPMTNVNFVIATTAASSILPKFAQMAELFRKFHINATVNFVSSTLALSELATGQAQFGCFGAPQPEEARNSGADIRWVAQWVLRSNLQLVAAPGISTPAQLAGKSIGVSTAGSTTDIFAHWIVQQSGLSTSSVKYVPLQSASGIISGFIGGSVDALLLSPPSSTNGMKGRPGSSIIVNTNSPKYTYPFNGLAGYMPWVNKHKQATIQVLEALTEALQQFPQRAALAEKAIIAASPTTSQADAANAYQSAESVFNKTSLVPDDKVEKTVLQLLTDFYPGQWPNAIPSRSSSFINRSYAVAAEKALAKATSGGKKKARK